MNDTTLIYKGTYNRLRPTPWKLGQFDVNILLFIYIHKIQGHVFFLLNY